MNPKLTEAEVLAAIPVMKAEIIAHGRLQQTIKDDREVLIQLAQDIQTGRIDPLDWLKMHSQNILVPRNAIYCPQCSRAVSIAGYERALEEMDHEALGLIPPNVRPTAVFTFGKTIAAINKSALDKKARNLDISGEILYDTNDPSYAEMRSILAKANAFYTQHGFSTMYNMSGDAIIFSPKIAEEEISGTIFQIYFDAFSSDFPTLRESCASLPVGPGIEIRAGDKLMDIFLHGAEAAASSSQTDFLAALARAKISEERYTLIKGALLTAKMNSDIPEEPMRESPAFTPSTPEEKKAASEYAQIVRIMNEEAGNKRHNILLYRKYRIELDPILDELQRFNEGP